MNPARLRSIGLGVLLLLHPLLGTAALASKPAYLSALVMDANTGKVLYGNAAHREVIPASLVKMMLLLLTMEQLQAGRVALTDQVTVSRAASRIGGHQVFLKQGEQVRLGDLFRAVLIGSANDAAFAMAEHVFGSHRAAVAAMNAKARVLGMDDTRFNNVHGLPPDRRRGERDNRTSAYDMALLARQLTHYPLVLKWSATRLDYFRQGRFQLLNTNRRFLKAVPGADGLKTGYHPRGASFCLVGTAKRDEKRLIVVVMGARDKNIRLTTAVDLISRGFSGKLAAFKPANLK